MPIQAIFALSEPDLLAMDMDQIMRYFYVFPVVAPIMSSGHGLSGIHRANTHVQNEVVAVDATTQPLKPVEALSMEQATNAATRAQAEASAVAAQAREKDTVQAWLRSNRPDLLDRSGGGGGGGGGTEGGGGPQEGHKPPIERTITAERRVRVRDVTMTASVHETERVDGITAEADTGSDSDAISARNGDGDGDGDGDGMLAVADAETGTEAADLSPGARSDGFAAGVKILASPALSGDETTGCATTSNPYDGGGAQSLPPSPSLPHYTQRLSAPCLLQVRTTNASLSLLPVPVQKCNC